MTKDEVTALYVTAAQMAGVPLSWVPAMVELTRRESGWNTKAKNPNSTAYGLFQFLDSTWKNYAKPGWDRDNPLHQTLAGIEYIKKRYGTPQKALEFWDKNRWY